MRYLVGVAESKKAWHSLLEAIEVRTQTRYTRVGTKNRNTLLPFERVNQKYLGDEGAGTSGAGLEGTAKMSDAAVGYFNPAYYSGVQPMRRSSDGDFD